MYRLYLQKAAANKGSIWFYIIREGNVEPGRSVGFFGRQDEIVKSLPLGELKDFNKILIANKEIRGLSRSEEKGEAPFSEQEMEKLAHDLKEEFHFEKSE